MHLELFDKKSLSIKSITQVDGLCISNDYKSKQQGTRGWKFIGTKYFFLKFHLLHQDNFLAPLI